MSKIKKNIVVITLIIIGIFVCFYGFSLAKYVSNSIWDYYLKSKGFYLSSDNLGSEVVKNVDNLWDGGSVYFNIRNSLNQTVVTNYDINYKVKCTIKGDAAQYAECRINGTEFNEQEGVLNSFQKCINNTENGIDVTDLNKTDCELGGYEWVNQIATKDLYFDVVLTDEQHEISDIVVNVTVNSTSPYKKTLTGDFILNKRNIEEEKISLNYKNYLNYDRLTVSNSYQEIKCVKVTWNADNLIIDTDSSNYSSYETNTDGYINEIKFNINGNDTKNYIFYKRNLQETYNVTGFSIEEDSGC